MTLFRPVGAAELELIRASGYFSAVTRFEIDEEFVKRYPVQTVGASEHQELWIPAEELEAFNAAIVGLIEVIAEYRGGAK